MKQLFEEWKRKDARRKDLQERPLNIETEEGRKQALNEFKEVSYSTEFFVFRMQPIWPLLDYFAMHF